MTIRAKFYCQSVEEFEYGKTARLTAVTGKEGEDLGFSTYTPAGSLEIQLIDKPHLTDFFKPGGSYYLDFQEANKG